MVSMLNSGYSETIYNYFGGGALGLGNGTQLDQKIFCSCAISQGPYYCVNHSLYQMAIINCVQNCRQLG